MEPYWDTAAQLVPLVKDSGPIVTLVSPNPDLAGDEAPCHALLVWTARDGDVNTNKDVIAVANMRVQQLELITLGRLMKLAFSFIADCSRSARGAGDEETDSSEETSSESDQGSEDTEPKVTRKGRTVGRMDVCGVLKAIWLEVVKPILHAMNLQVRFRRPFAYPIVPD